MKLLLSLFAAAAFLNVVTPLRQGPGHGLDGFLL
jgi:hypothetical protein